MLFTTQPVEKKELDTITNFFAEFENEEIKTVDAEEVIETPVSKYITSLVCGQYAKSVDEIANTKVGNKLTRKRSLQQVMRESFFYGANRFGNNFIA
jgi:hypothetical protein